MAKEKIQALSDEDLDSVIGGGGYYNAGTGQVFYSDYNTGETIIYQNMEDWKKNGPKAK